MKTLKMKSAVLATIFAGAVVIGSITPAMAGAPVLTVEKTAINKDLSHVSATRERVTTLKSQLKGDRKAGLNTVALNKELRKAKADHTQAKAYLRADKRDLVMDHQAYIKEKKAALREDRYALAKTRFDVKRSPSQKSADIMNKRMEINDDKSALIQAKTTRNNDLLAANDKIEKAQGQNVATLKIENAGAKLQNLAMK
ncbi:MAG: hypothetical protein JST76_15790 [Bacteroidetes bacterium]|nr:hypothetical protein [Bacteroidota bacterium]MBS1619981.1 hypothetical protein [Bacteroidota bacterium]